MNRWNEIKCSLGFNILLPRFCLFVGLPCLILVLVPAPPAIPPLLVALYPHYVALVITAGLLLFGLSIAANLSISRYLRLHQTGASPYVYETGYDAGRRTSFFRIQAWDTDAFRVLLKNLRRENQGKGIWFWLLLDDLLFVPPIAILALFVAIFMFIPSLAVLLLDKLKHRKPRPV